MDYNVKGTGLEITNELRSYLDKRLAQHVEKFVRGDGTAHLDIELEFAQGERSKKYRAELTLTLDGDMYRVEEHGDGMHEAIDIATDALSNEVSRMKKKKMHILRTSAGRVKEYIRGFRRKV